MKILQKNRDDQMKRNRQIIVKEEVISLQVIKDSYQK